MRLIGVVAAGGMAGALARHAMEVVLPWQQRGWPWAVFLVNMLGCLAIGLATGMLADARARGAQVPHWWRPLVVTGFLGGFTTFSTYILEVVILVESGTQAALALALSYLFGSVAAGVVAVWLGLRMAARVPWRTWSADVDIG
jgi:fluoride exporter